VITDPWLSPHGAFDSAWFQFPRNHHLAPFVREKLSESSKERFVYISHEHGDHFDQEFLNSVQNRDFTIVIPHFRRAALRAAFADYRPKALVSCIDKQEIAIPGGYLKLYLDNSGLNRDSAIIIRAEGQSFLDLNDCKLYDILPSIAQDQGPFDVFTCQFSGATWHPTCYEYPPAVYERVSERKVLSKFETVARAIETITPRVFLPSAGPACFLDPMLIQLNFERVNIFPRAPKLLRYLGKRLPNSHTRCMEIMPGDVLDVESGRYVRQAEERVDEENFEPYIRSYAALYEGFFAERKTECLGISTVLERLRAELRGMIGENHIWPLVGLFGFSGERAPITNVRRLGMPKYAGYSTFAFCSSESGNLYCSRSSNVAPGMALRNCSCACSHWARMTFSGP